MRKISNSHTDSSEKAPWFHTRCDLVELSSKSHADRARRVVVVRRSKSDHRVVVWETGSSQVMLKSMCPSFRLQDGIGKV